MIRPQKTKTGHAVRFRPYLNSLYTPPGLHSEIPRRAEIANSLRSRNFHSENIFRNLVTALSPVPARTCFQTVALLLPRDHAQRNLRRVLPRVVHRVMRHQAFRFVVVIAARIEITVEPGEVTARNLDPDSMPRVEVIAGRHRLEHYLIDLPRLHPRGRPLIPVAIAHALDRLVEIVRPPVRVHV